MFDRTAERAEATLDLQRARILSAVRTLFYEVLTMERRVEVQERLAALASEAVGITAQLFNVGALRCGCRAIWRARDWRRRGPVRTPASRAWT